MANITYARTFRFDPWVDNQDTVAAEGPKGFNQRFRDLEAEFDVIAGVVGQINSALGVSIQTVATISKNLTPNQVTEPEEIDVYNNATVPAGTKKVYQVSIEPGPGGHGQVSYNLIYTAAAGEITKVSIWFKEERNLATRIVARIFSIS